MYKIQIIQNGVTVGTINYSGSLRNWTGRAYAFADSLKIYGDIETGYYDAVIYDDRNIEKDREVLVS